MVFWWIQDISQKMRFFDQIRIMNCSRFLQCKAVYSTWTTKHRKNKEKIVVWDIKTARRWKRRYPTRFRKTFIKKPLKQGRPSPKSHDATFPLPFLPLLPSLPFPLSFLFFPFPLPFPSIPFPSLRSRIPSNLARWSVGSAASSPSGVWVPPVEIEFGAF